jgi:hypothetical protein
MPGSCVVCQRNPPDRGTICHTDLQAIEQRLTDLPRKIDALALRIIPGHAAPAERVTTSQPHPPPPARLDPLSLTGPGSEYVEAVLHPVTRWYPTERLGQVSVMVAPGQIEIQDRMLVDWRREYAYDPDGAITGTPGAIIARGDNDQVGALPVGEWLDSWVRRWRTTFGHGVPARTRRTPVGTESADRDKMWRAMLHANPATSPAAAAMAAAWRQTAARVVLGLDTHTRSGDPVADEWDIRFGPAPRQRGVRADVAYLALWLPHAAARDDLGLGEFATELRAVDAELTRLLGDTPDQQYLGRCPVFVEVEHVNVTTEPDADVAPVKRPCGAPLWQDPFASQVSCQRCHASWGPKMVELLGLARDIRRVWPVDRRRRYTQAEIVELVEAGRMPWCRTCYGHRVVVDWLEVTAPGDPHPTWRPARVSCPAGCQAGADDPARVM